MAPLAHAVDVVYLVEADADMLVRPLEVLFFDVLEHADLGGLPELSRAPFAGDAIGSVGPVRGGPGGRIVRVRRRRRHGAALLCLLRDARVA